MPAYLKSDPARGAGCGIIEVPGLSLGSCPSFVLQRSSDGQCLSPNGWQAAEAPLTPEAWDGDSGLARLAVGPQVVDYMDELDTYRITLREGGSQPHVQTLLVQGLVYSSMHGGQGMKGASPVPPPPPVPVPEPEPDPLPEPQPAPVPESLSMTPPPPGEEEKKSKAPLLIGKLIFLLAVGGGLWWYLQQQKAANPTAETAPAAPTTQSPAPAPAAPKLSPLQAAREHLRSGGDAAKGLELAKSADMQSPEAADAVFLLMEDAAQKGQGEAMLRLAAFYDPTDQSPKGSIKADAAEALNWYQKAKDAGQAAAEAKITALRQWQDGQKAAPAPAAPAAPAPTAPAAPAPTAPAAPAPAQGTPAAPPAAPAGNAAPSDAKPQ